MNLIERIAKEMAGDYDEDLDNQSERLADLYAQADDSGKELLDNAFVCLCGWRLKTLLDKGTG